MPRGASIAMACADLDNSINYSIKEKYELKLFVFDKI